VVQTKRLVIYKPALVIISPTLEEKQNMLIYYRHLPHNHKNFSIVQIISIKAKKQCNFATKNNLTFFSKHSNTRLPEQMQALLFPKTHHLKKKNPVAHDGSSR